MSNLRALNKLADNLQSVAPSEAVAKLRRISERLRDISTELIGSGAEAVLELVVPFFLTVMFPNLGNVLSRKGGAL